MRTAANFAVEFLGNQSHAWLLLMLGLLYGGLVIVLGYQQVKTGQKADVELLKEVGGTLIWWGGIVATGATAKKMTTTIKGNGAAPADPAPAPAPGAAGV
jgi:hypothetical protein